MRLPKSARIPIELAFKCEEIIGKNPVYVSLSKRGTLRIGIEPALGELPQYQREIIKFYLAKYALQLSHEFQRNIGDEPENWGKLLKKDT